ncbi:MAG: hypothetical protein VR69_06865 [Peptococcaceae bacterium BRH_c4b]|nr:MAG: hypothetical protein VR69_06865 [Peptococcaceae bacterium BRH_c4b]
MGAQLQVDRDKVEIFAYGLEIILGALLQLTILLLLSLFMDTFITTMICLIAFASLRYFGGGVHLNTYSGCLIVGVSLLLGLGKLATIDVSLEALTVISVLALLMGTYTIFRWAPAGTEKKQIKDETTRLRQRKKALLVITVWSIITVVLIKQKLNANAFAAVLGAFGSFILITPLGYKAFKAFDNILNIIWKGVRRCLER